MLDYQASVHTPIGQLGIQINQQQVCRIDLLAEVHSPIKSQDPVGILAANELKQYFHDPSFMFTVPYRLQGTVKQQQIWQALCSIPIGHTLSYGELAQRLMTHPRVIGNACRANLLLILIPCHRVTAKHHLGGYRGSQTKEQLKIKSWLLSHEKYTNSVDFSCDAIRYQRVHY